jgi:hypothetical protein
MAAERNTLQSKNPGRQRIKSSKGRQ